MFDDPKKKLQELEEQLLAAEEHDEEFQKIYAEVLAEFGPGGTDEAEPPIRNFANGYGGDFPSQPQKPVETISEEQPAKKERFGFLVFLFCLECLAIGGVAAFWLINTL